MSNDLEWLLIRKQNSFLVKRLPEGPIFSKEPGNLLNIHSHKYSGVANSKPVLVVDSPSGIQIITKKKDAAPNVVRGARVTTTIKPRTGPRRAARIAANNAKRGYRPDLRTATLARVSALASAQKEPKPTPPTKLRGKKAKALYQ